MSFLEAQWRKLIMANYEVDSSILQPYVPAGTELDFWEGKCYVSLVAFMFLDTRMLGFKIPFHVNFEECNLRFYVRRKENGEWKRGVVFIKEIVPKLAISLVANWVYKEHYETMPMRHNWKEEGDIEKVAYAWKKKGKWHSIEVEAQKNALPIKEGSTEEFICEHYWGYSRINDTKSTEYEVTHPRWLHHPVQSFHIDVNFAQVYGDQFEFLNQKEPASVLLAEGSAITVESKRIISI